MIVISFMHDTLINNKRWKSDCISTNSMIIKHLRMIFMIISNESDTKICDLRIIIGDCDYSFMNIVIIFFSIHENSN